MSSPAASGRPRYLSFLIAVAPIIAVACVGQVEEEGTNPETSTVQAAWTISEYNPKVAIVAPLQRDPNAPTALDGKITSPGEWAGSLRVPVVNYERHIQTWAYLSADVPLAKMRVFVENMPIGSGDRAEDTTVCFYLDYKRFAQGQDTLIDRSVVPGDWGFCVNPGLAKGSVLRPTQLATGAHVWQLFNAIGRTSPPSLLCRLFPVLCPPVPPDRAPDWAFKVGDVAAEAPGSTNLRVSIELELPLINFQLQDSLDATHGGKPGVGLGIVVHGAPRGLGAFGGGTTPGTNVSHVVGGYPQAVSDPESALAIGRDVLAQRARYASVLFGQPEGRPLKVMSWNVKRFTSFMRKFEKGSAFKDKDVPPELLGRTIAPYDIVAIQEGWNADAVQRILVEANNRRAAQSLPPYNLYGPLSFDTSWWSTLNPTNWADETHGGLWIFSPFEAQIKDQGLVFDHCRGEDCLKAKGVQWVRLWLGGPKPGCIARCEAHGDDFVDVFNIHANADQTLCDDDSPADRDKLYTEIEEWVSGIPSYLSTKIVQRFQDIHCGDEQYNGLDSLVRAKQLVEAGEFIQKATSDARDRPSLILGDFNLNARRINGYEYRRMLYSLGITTNQDFEGDEYDPYAAEPAPDWLSPVHPPYGWDWDVDHADVYRSPLPGQTDKARRDELFDQVPYKPGGQYAAGEGTWIAADGVPYSINTGQEVDPLLKGYERLDFMLLRPPQPADGNGSTQPVSWVWGRHEQDPVWSSFWPAPDPAVVQLVCPADASTCYRTRLSDHKPIIGSFEIMPFRVPPEFHPDWQHEWEYRITAANSKETDCIGCGKPDMYVKTWAGAGGPWFVSGVESETCVNESRVAYTIDGCMHNWFASHTQAIDSTTKQVIETYLLGATQLWEADNGPNDHLSNTIAPGGDPRAILDYVNSQFAIRAFTNSSVKPTNAKDILISDNDPLPYCGNGATSSVCLRVTSKEVPK